MHHDDALLPLSALQHLLFCPRQCALIHLEQLWAENRLTVEGRHLHQKAHEGPNERRGQVSIVRGVPLKSLELGLIGKADVVEIEPLAGKNAADLPARKALDPTGLFDRIRASPAAWRVTPVEYKRGRPKKDDCDRVQLAAQAMCLEEALGVRIECAALFYGKPRRRSEVPIDPPLRQLVADTARRLHELIDSRATPPARREPKCGNCSLVDLCLPGAMRSSRTAAVFAQGQFDGHLGSASPQCDAFDGPE